MNDIQLSQHFTVAELCNLKKYPKNIPTIQQITSMTYGCRHLLEPAREAIGCPIIINSGFRNAQVNRQVGGVSGSQHLLGQAADIRPKDPAQFQRLVNYLKTCENSYLVMRIQSASIQPRSLLALVSTET